MISSLWHFPCIRSPGGTRGARSIKTNEKSEHFLLKPKGEGLHFSTLFRPPTGKKYGVCERCCHSDSGGTNLSVKTWRMCETVTSSEPPHPPQQQMKRPVTTTSEWFLCRNSYQQHHAWLMGWLRPILIEKEKDKEGSLMETLSQTPSGESPCSTSLMEVVGLDPQRWRRRSHSVNSSVNLQKPLLLIQMFRNVTNSNNLPKPEYIGELTSIQLRRESAACL